MGGTDLTKNLVLTKLLAKACDEVRSMYYVRKFVSNLWQIDGFFGYFGLLPPKNGHSVESGVKHHTSYSTNIFYVFVKFRLFTPILI